MVDYYFICKDFRFSFTIFGKTFNFLKVVPSFTCPLFIGTSSYHSVFTFNSNDYFSSYKEFEDFYYKNKKVVIILSEYNEEISFGDLLELINFNQDKKKTKYLKEGFVYEDEFGYCFIKEK